MGARHQAVRLFAVAALAAAGLGGRPAAAQAAPRFDGGIGLQVGVGARGVRVIRVLPGGAAGQAGVRAGDVVVSVDGKTLVGLALEDAVCSLRGALGSTAQLELERAGQARSVYVSVPRTVALKGAGSGEVEVCGLRIDLFRLRRHQLILRGTMESLNGRQVSLESQKEQIERDAAERSAKLHRKAGVAEGAANANAQAAEAAKAVSDAALAAGKQGLGLVGGLLGGLFESQSQVSQANAKRLLDEAADIRARAEKAAAELQSQAGELQAKVARLEAAIARLDSEIEVKDLLVTAETGRQRSVQALERIPSLKSRLDAHIKRFLDQR